MTVTCPLCLDRFNTLSISRLCQAEKCGIARAIYPFIKDLRYGHCFPIHSIYRPCKREWKQFNSIDPAGNYPLSNVVAVCL